MISAPRTRADRRVSPIGGGKIGEERSRSDVNRRHRADLSRKHLAIYKRNNVVRIRDDRLRATDRLPIAMMRWDRRHSWRDYLTAVPYRRR